MLKACEIFTKQRTVALVLMTIALLLDQWSKGAALYYLGDALVPVVDGFFNLRLAWNRGVSFSMLGSIPHAELPIWLGVMAFSVAVIFTIWLSRAHGWCLTSGLGLMIGGALGNGIDRFRHGAVVDFLDFYYDKWHWPTFNVADIAICIGVVLILLDAVFESFDGKNK